MSSANVPCIAQHGCDTGVCEKNTPPEKEYGNTSFKNTTSGAGEQFLLLDFKAKACTKGCLFVTDTDMMCFDCRCLKGLAETPRDVREQEDREFLRRQAKTMSCNYNIARRRASLTCIRRFQFEVHVCHLKCCI